MTAASIFPFFRAEQSVSEIPKLRKLSIAVTLSSVHMPNELMRYSMFSLIDSLFSSSMPLRFAKRGQYLTLGSVTSTTFPSSMVTRLIPRHSMTCLDIVSAPLRWNRLT